MSVCPSWGNRKLYIPSEVLTGSKCLGAGGRGRANGVYPFIPTLHSMLGVTLSQAQLSNTCTFAAGDRDIPETDADENAGGGPPVVP